MNRENKQTTCALCGKDDKLKNSHIIPKLVYTRMKSQSKSRFRVLGNPKFILNDGDKTPMLCSECESYMSKYETYFANNFFDPYLNQEKIKCLESKELIDVISIINWRVLYDDLFLFGSINEFPEYHKDNFIVFEKELRNHLLKLKRSKTEELPSFFLNELFTLEYLQLSSEAINYFSNFIFGYSYFDEITGFYTVISHFTGLLLITRFKVKNFVYINNSISKKELKKQGKFTHYSIQKKLINQYRKIVEFKKINDEILDQGLGDKIKKYLGI